MIPLILASLLKPAVMAAGKNFLSGMFAQGGAQQMAPFSGIQGGAGYDELMSIAPNVLGQQGGQQQAQSGQQRPNGLLNLGAGSQAPQVQIEDAQPARIGSVQQMGGQYRRQFKGLLG